MKNLGILGNQLKSQLTKDTAEVNILIQHELNSLCKNLKKNVGVELATIGIDMDNKLKHLAQNQKQSLHQHLNQYNRILKDIERKHSRISANHKQAIQSLKWNWWKPITVGLLFSLAVAGGNWGILQYLSQQLLDLNLKIEQQEQILHQVQQRGKWNNCDGQPCVQIDLTADDYQDGYRILNLQ